uniref:Nuclear receptor 2C2 associated protein n=1 Tax=Corvus moneduloides TaxID=1196302 RepID=A0A8U7NER7_CORMO
MQGHAGFLGFRAAGICRDSGMVSSVLNRDVKQFGKQHLFDGSEETCWNSDQGTSQWVTLDFPQPVKVSQLHIQFQGGFSSRLCTLEGCRTGEELVKISELYPQDSHALQISFPRMMMMMGGWNSGIFLFWNFAAVGAAQQSWGCDPPTPHPLRAGLASQSLRSSFTGSGTDSRWRRRCWIS